MFAASNVSVREKVVLAAGASLLAVLCACATASAPQPSPAPESGVISELQVENEGAATIVSLLGLAEPVFSRGGRAESSAHCCASSLAFFRSRMMS